MEFLVGTGWLLADESVDTPLTTITDVFDFYGRDLSADSGHTLMIGETRYALNYSKLDLQTLIEIGGYVPKEDINSQNIVRFIGGGSTRLHALTLVAMAGMDDQWIGVHTIV